ncbi:universal stress protein [Paenibacillus hodogayensis]|uniref:Universal stress protein n=1 Tax=Paenibacillus hodogayensis TaxID=279208 RepID=A0ABV5W1X0_9BACL
MRKILFATDGSKYSGHAGRMTEELLKAWPEAECTVLYVTVRENYAYDLVPDAVRFEEKLSQMIEKEIYEQFSLWQDRIRFMNLTGHPVKSICAVSAEEKADLIVMGSRGRGLMKEALLGSVTHGVLHHADVPVLVAKS